MVENNKELAAAAAATRENNNSSLKRNSVFEMKRAFTDNPNQNNRFYRGKFLEAS